MLSIILHALAAVVLLGAGFLGGDYYGVTKSNKHWNNEFEKFLRGLANVRRQTGQFN